MHSNFKPNLGSNRCSYVKVSTDFLSGPSVLTKCFDDFATLTGHDPFQNSAKPSKLNRALGPHRHIQTVGSVVSVLVFSFSAHKKVRCDQVGEVPPLQP
jgi:hypothetical protein